MPILFIEKLQQQLSQRSEMLYQCNWEYFQANLKAYFKFIGSNPVLKEVVDELRKEQTLSVNEWLEKYNTERMPYFPDETRSQAAQSLVILEAAKSGAQRQAFLSFVMLDSSGNLHEMKRIFLNNFFYPFHSFLEERVNESNFHEFVLRRYKMWCEWYRREELKKKLAVEQKIVDAGQKKKREFEKILTADAVSFIFLNGLTPISLTLGNCKPDITTDIFALNPLITEVKIFIDKNDISELKFGSRQLKQALSTTGLVTGFLIVFNIGRMNLEIINDVENRSLITIVVNVTEIPPSELKGTVKINASDLQKGV